MVDIAEIMSLKENADCLVTTEEISSAIDNLASAIQHDYADKNPILLCVMNGGLFFTSELTKRLDFPFVLDYLHATRYGEELRGDEVIWKAMPQLDLSGRHVLILDDILDEGHTLLAIQNALESQNVASLKTAVLTVKLHDRRTEGVEVAYQGVSLPDRYAFGCGMDLKGYYRNLTAVYAIQE